MPRLQQNVSVFCNDCCYGTELVTAEASAFCNAHILEPNLHRCVRAVNMDVRRLVRLMAEKVEAVGALAEDGGHGSRVSFWHKSEQAINF
jgi:hypothetical protein